MTEGPGMWDRLLGQGAAVRALRSAIESERTGHAYVFVGPEGVGRGPAALALAASLNCPDRGCGSCGVCRRVLRRAHPDVHLVSAEGGQIVVDQVRALREEASRAPFEGRTKVFVIEEAERLNAAAANALLKVLEEPPGDALFVLMTDTPDDLLPTVVSRCRRLDFVPLARADVVEILTRHHDVPDERARWAAAAAGENLATALRLAKDEAAEERRKRHLSYPARLRSGTLAEAIRLADEVREHADAAVDAVRSRHRQEAREHADAFGEGRGTATLRKRLETRHKRELRRVEQQTYEIVLADLAAWYRGAILGAAGEDAALDAQTAVALEAARPLPSQAGALEALAHIESARRALSRNAQVGLALEALFMRLGASPAGRARGAA